MLMGNRQLRDEFCVFENIHKMKTETILFEHISECFLSIFHGGLYECFVIQNVPDL